MTSYSPGSRSVALGRACRLVGRLLTDRGGVDGADVGLSRLRIARGPIVAHHHRQQLGLRDGVAGAQPVGVGDGDGRVSVEKAPLAIQVRRLGRARSRRVRLPRAARDRPGRSRPRSRARCRRSGSAGGQRRGVRVGCRPAAELGGARHDLGDAPRRRGGWCSPRRCGRPSRNRMRRRGVVLGHVLMDARAGEARQRRVAAPGRAPPPRPRTSAQWPGPAPPPAPLAGRHAWLPSADPHLHVPEARRRGAVADAVGLHRLTLAAVRHPPQPPLRIAADRVAAAPELAA